MFRRHSRERSTTGQKITQAGGAMAVRRAIHEEVTASDDRLAKVGRLLAPRTVTENSNLLQHDTDEKLQTLITRLEAEKPQLAEGKAIVATLRLAGLDGGTAVSRTGFADLAHRLTTDLGAAIAISNQEDLDSNVYAATNVGLSDTIDRTILGQRPTDQSICEALRAANLQTGWQSNGVMDGLYIATDIPDTWLKMESRITAEGDSPTAVSLIMLPEQAHAPINN